MVDEYMESLFPLSEKMRPNTSSLLVKERVRIITSLSRFIIFFFLAAFRSFLLHSENNPFAEELKQQSRQMERNYQIYGGGHVSFYSAQFYAEGNSLNRMSGYFVPQGVNIFNPDQLTRAVQQDQRQRQSLLTNLIERVDSQIRTIHERQNQTIEKVLDRAGQLTTYDKGTLRIASDQLRSLGNETEKLESYLQAEFRNQFREKAAAPYLERAETVELLQKTDQLVAHYLQGSDPNFAGLSGLKKGLRANAAQLFDLARQIESSENNMRGAFIESYLLSGMQIGIGFLTLPVGGAFMVSSGILQLGSGIRNNVLLNEKGIESFQSKSEKQFAVGLQSAQQALSTAQAVLGLKNLISSTIHASRQGTLFSSSEKSFLGFQFVRSGVSAAEATGLMRNSLGEQERSYLNASLAGANLIFWGSGSSSSLNIKLNEPLYKLSKTPGALNAATALNSPHPLSLASQIVSDSLTFAQISSKGRDWSKENDFALQAGLNLMKIAEIKTEKSFNQTKFLKAHGSIENVQELYHSNIEAAKRDELPYYKNARESFKIQKIYASLFPILERKREDELLLEKGFVRADWISAESRRNPPAWPTFNEVKSSYLRKEIEGQFPTIVRILKDQECSAIASPRDIEGPYKSAGQEILSFNMAGPLGHGQTQNAVAEMQALLFSLNPIGTFTGSTSEDLNLSPATIKTVQISALTAKELKRYYSLAKKNAPYEDARFKGALITIQDASKFGQVDISFMGRESQRNELRVRYNPNSRSWSSPLEELAQTYGWQIKSKR